MKALNLPSRRSHKPLSFRFTKCWKRLCSFWIFLNGNEWCWMILSDFERLWVILSSHENQRESKLEASHTLVSSLATLLGDSWSLLPVLGSLYKTPFAGNVWSHTTSHAVYDAGCSQLPCTAANERVRWKGLSSKWCWISLSSIFLEQSPEDSHYLNLSQADLYKRAALNMKNSFQNCVSNVLFFFGPPVASESWARRCAGQQRSDHHTNGYNKHRPLPCFPNIFFAWFLTCREPFIGRPTRLEKCYWHTTNISKRNYWQVSQRVFAQNIGQPLRMGIDVLLTERPQLCEVNDCKKMHLPRSFLSQSEFDKNIS